MVFGKKQFTDWKKDPLVIALAISIVLHIGVIGGWKIGQHFDLWKKFPMPTWLQKITEKLAALSAVPKNPPSEKETPLVFIDVDPNSIVKEPPPDTKFYSSANTQLASPKKLDTDAPEIKGQQDKVLKTVENTKSTAQPLQPSPPKVQQQPQPEPEQKAVPPKAQETPGDLAFSKPQKTPEKSESENKEKEKPVETPEHVRPRTLAEVKRGALGEKMKQQGGAPNVSLQPSFNVKITSFGDYDREFIDAVRQRWYSLLEGRSTVPGRIVVEFHLNYDGRITELKVVENSTGNSLLELICKGAISDPSPYRKWPAEMRREMKSDSREVRFTFFYQ